MFTRSTMPLCSRSLRTELPRAFAQRPSTALSRLYERFSYAPRDRIGTKMAPHGCERCHRSSLMLEETPRLPCPINWNEQDQLFSRLPARLARMVLFAVNTGLRESNVCKLKWEWEVAVPEVGRTVFVVPPEAYKTRRAHVVILNDVAWSVIQGQRGEDPVWVFPYRGKPVGTMNNTAWQRARKEVGLPRVRIHDLRHTFACRLRAVGVSMEDRQVLLGHANRSMAGHLRKRRRRALARTS
jgi:integrase